MSRCQTDAIHGWTYVHIGMWLSLKKAVTCKMQDKHTRMRAIAAANERHVMVMDGNTEQEVFQETLLHMLMSRDFLWHASDSASSVT